MGWKKKEDKKRKEKKEENPSAFSFLLFLLFLLQLNTYSDTHTQRILWVMWQSEI